jgi:hypothetical protein
MKKTIKLLSILFLFGAIFMSCEGPAGIDGVDGVAGDPGADGTAVCMTCHDAGTAYAAKVDQFNESAHALGTYYSRGGECAGCHSTEGYLARAEFTSITEIADLGVDNQSAISCKTCHMVHATYDVTDWDLTFADQVTETLFGSASTTDAYESISFADYGDGNMCLQCHQARDRGNTPAADATADVTTGSTHWGPHYGVQGNVLLASGGVNVAGDLSYPSATAGHASLDAACISCHMVDGNHTLAVGYSACDACHTDAEDMVDDLHDEIDALKFALGKELAAQGVASVDTETSVEWDEGLGVHVETIDTVGFGPKNMTMTASQAKALYNYMVVYQDHSYGVHNPSYVRALLNNSIDLITAK